MTTLKLTVIGLIGILLLSGCTGEKQEVSTTPSKEVSVCTTYVIGSDMELQCDGPVKGKTTLKEMYKNGWELEESVAGGYKFILILTK